MALEEEMCKEIIFEENEMFERDAGSVKAKWWMHFEISNIPNGWDVDERNSVFHSNGEMELEESKNEGSRSDFWVLTYNIKILFW